jgi:HAD superfamily phosphatase
VIRDVGGSYRRAIVETVQHYSGVRPEPSAIDALKAEGCWNNDWDASLELLRRSGLAQLPAFEALVEVFNGFYFGGDPEGDPGAWQGFIGTEPLLVEPSFFEELSGAGVVWGFVSGAEPPSARFVLEQRLGLNNPPLIAMGDAPDKPDPTGFLRLAAELSGGLGSGGRPVAIWATPWPMCSPCSALASSRAHKPFSAWRWHHPTCRHPRPPSAAAATKRSCWRPGRMP